MRYLILVFSFIAAAALAAGLWHDPEIEGHGLHIPDDGHGAVIWFLNTPDIPDGRPEWLISDENCEGWPCETTLLRVTGSFIEGAVSYDPVGVITLEEEGDQIKLGWDLVDWLPDDYCDTGPGGLILRGCIGTTYLERLQ